jgi:hypothetical protein
MLKKSASFVLAALRGSTYHEEYAFASSLAAAALDSLFEHPEGYSDPISDLLRSDISRCRNGFSTAC